MNNFQKNLVIIKERQRIINEVKSIDLDKETMDKIIKAIENE